MIRVFLICLTLTSGAFCQAPKGSPINPINGYRVHSSELPNPAKVTGQKALFATAPSDADILFNGENTDAWDGDWLVQDGILIASEGHLTTTSKYRDCQLHIEFRIPKERKVSSQKGSNSGIFLMERYEIQVLESHDNNTYADGQAAAVYGQYPPLVNASISQGEWQSYDIIFNAPVYEGNQVVQPAQVTVLHNGVVAHHSLEIKGPTRYNKVAKYPKSHPTKAPIRLQWHEDPVEYRNIWVRGLGSYPKK